MAKCKTCGSQKNKQESGDWTCPNIVCTDVTKVDLVPSCCLMDTYEEAGIIRCSGCDAVVDDVRFEEREAEAFHRLNDYCGFGEENPTPPGPDQLSEAWGAIRGLMERRGIKLPVKAEKEE